MSYTWTSTNLDGEAHNAHPLSCPVWSSSDPTDVCTCDPTGTEIQRLQAELAEHRRLRTLGGPPPPPTSTSWENVRLPGGAEPEYRDI